MRGRWPRSMQSIGLLHFFSLCQYSLHDFKLIWLKTQFTLLFLVATGSQTWGGRETTPKICKDGERARESASGNTRQSNYIKIRINKKNEKNKPNVATCCLISFYLTAICKSNNNNNKPRTKNAHLLSVQHQEAWRERFRDARGW